MSILVPFSVYPTVNLTKGVIEMTGWMKYIGLAVILTLLQCKGDEKPKGVLTEQEMVNLMVELYLAEARVTLTGIPRDSAAKLFNPYEETLVAKRGISDSTLKANYNYYLQNPDKLERILDAVIDTLNLREQRAGEQP
ncbi:MAG TPA: hypothetical protein DIS90_02585 [Cytophagales bacterium]|nr:hypothetical protein [Cytophagales bacterium]